MANLDQRQYAPAFQRNCHPILAVLKQELPNRGMIVEIASGTGEHAAFFAQHFPQIQWVPSDMAQPQLDSIAAWRDYHRLSNLYTPMTIDLLHHSWPQIVSQGLNQEELPIVDVVAIVNINMMHISSWEATLSLMAGAARLLPPQGLLYLYGPFMQAGQSPAPSNLAFDQSLRRRNPAWGIRSLTDVVAAANDNDLILQKTVEMPANNLSILLQRSSEARSIFHGNP